MRIPLIGELDSRDGTLTKSPFLRNGFLSKAEDKLYLEKRPGLRLYDALGAGTGQALISYFDPDTEEDVLLPIVGASVYAQSVSLSNTLTQTSGKITLGALTTIWAQQPALVSFGGYLWALGGFCATSSQVDQPTRQFAYYSADGITWQAAFDVAAGDSNYPSVRSAVFVVYDNKLWCIGGVQSNGNYLTDVWNTSDGVTWTQVSAGVSGWTAGAGGFGPKAGCVHNGKMYVLAGNASFLDGTGANVNVYYSTDGITWTACAAKPWTIAGNSKSFIGGGILSLGSVLIIPEGATADSRVTCYYSTDNGATWSSFSNTNWQTGVAGPNMQGAVAINGYCWALMPASANPAPFTWWYTNDGFTWTDSGLGTAFLSNDLPSPEGRRAKYSGTSIDATNGYCAFKGKVWCYEFAHNTAQATQGIHYFSFGSTVLTTSIGTVLPGKYDVAQVYQRNKLMVKTDVIAYSFDTASKSFSEITDGDYPTKTVRGCVYLNGIFYVMDPDGTIWGSDEDDPTAWTSTNFVSAEFEPDAGVAIAKLDSYLVAFGRYTIEQFWDAGNSTGSTLSPVTSTPVLTGCANGDSLQEADGALYFTAQNKISGQGFGGGRFIGVLRGSSVKRASSPAVDKILEADGLSDVDSCVVSKAGYTFYVLTLNTSGITLVLQIQSGEWYVWTQQTVNSAQSVTSITRSREIATVTLTSHGFASGDLITIAGADQSEYNGTFPIIKVNANSFTFQVDQGATTPATGTITADNPTAGKFPLAFSANYNNMQLVLGAADGNVYELDSDTFQDNSQFIDFRVRTEKYDGRTDKSPGDNVEKFISSLEIIGDKVTAGNLHIRWSDDDMANFVKWRRLDPTAARTRINRCGSFRRRTFELLHTDNTAMRHEGLEADIEKGV